VFAAEEEGADGGPVVVEVFESGEEIGGVEALLVGVEAAIHGEAGGACLDVKWGDGRGGEEAAKDHGADQGGIARGEGCEEGGEAVALGGVLKDDASAETVDVIDLEPVEWDEGLAL